MTNEEAVALINGGADGGHVQHWMDLGCGGGTFTHALATILPAGSKVTGVDKTIQKFSYSKGAPVSIEFLQADFEKDALNVPEIDGILMANSLHFVSDKFTLLRRLESSFKGQKRFLVVEYDTSHPNPWVPYPIAFTELQALFYSLGRYSVTKLGERRSRYGNGMMYGALVVT